MLAPMRAVISAGLLWVMSVLAMEGKVVFEGPIESRILKTNRTVRIYLPGSYDEQPKKRYPVLYVQDGQNAFSTAGPHVAFGWGNWELDRTTDRLVREGKMREIMIVAIDCGPYRYREYRGPIASGQDNEAYARYARFLIEELKPRIDRDYRTLIDADNTAVLGSSMGGIFSLAIAWEHPEVFGGAASLSGAFQVERQYFVKEVLGPYRSKPKPLRVYLDSGTMDHSGSDDGEKETTAVARELRRIGISIEHFIDRSLTPEELAPLNLAPDKFKEAQRSHHNELYWRLRAWRALTFLFPPIK
jgi:predicted alpha/beta superfamily hydrolase